MVDENNSVFSMIAKKACQISDFEDKFFVEGGGRKRKSSEKEVDVCLL